MKVLSKILFAVLLKKLNLHQEFAVIHSVIDSAIKNGKSAFHAVKAMIVELPTPLNASG